MWKPSLLPRRFGPRILDDHIIPSLITSLTSTHHGKHILQHTLCIFPHKLRLLTKPELSYLILPWIFISLEVSSSRHATMKAKAWQHKSKRVSTFWGFGGSWGATNVETKCATSKLWPPGSSSAYHAYPYHVTDKYTPRRTHTSAYTRHFHT